MTEKQFSAQSFAHAICLDAPVEDVFYHIATADGLTRWFIGDCRYTNTVGAPVPPTAMVEKGDTYHWKWLEKDLELAGEVLACRAAESVSFSFGEHFRVDLSLSLAEDGRTRLDLVQTAVRDGYTAFSHINCCVCWTFFLTNLKSVIEFDNDLRETQAHEEILVNR